MFGFVACLSDDDDTPKTVAVTGVSVSPESVSVETGDEITLTATVEPENATNKTVHWSSDDDETATARRPRATA